MFLWLNRAVKERSGASYSSESHTPTEPPTLSLSKATPSKSHGHRESARRLEQLVLAVEDDVVLGEAEAVQEQSLLHQKRRSGAVIVSAVLDLPRYLQPRGPGQGGRPPRNP